MRFPPDFMFQLTREEVLTNRSQFVTASTRNTSTPPFAFTEQGIAMLSGVLKSDIDSLCIAIGELAEKLEERKKTPRRRIGF